MRFFQLKEIEAGIAQSQMVKVIFDWCVDIILTLNVISDSTIDQERITKIVDILFNGCVTGIYRIQALTNFIGTSMRSATCSGVIPLFMKRLHTTFMFSPTSIICLSGS